MDGLFKIVAQQEKQIRQNRWRELPICSNRCLER